MLLPAMAGDSDHVTVVAGLPVPTTVATNVCEVVAVVGATDTLVTVDAPAVVVAVVVSGMARFPAASNARTATE